MDAVSQGALLANSSHVLFYSLIVRLLYFFPSEADGGVHSLEVPRSSWSLQKPTPHLGVKACCRTAEAGVGGGCLALLARSVGRELGG